jgi:hypothetical protein
MLGLLLVCHRFATRGVEAAHRLLQAHLGSVQVRARLRQIRVAQQLLHMMDGPALLKPETTSLVPEVVEVQIHRFELSP